jgi:FAD synthase
LFSGKAANANVAVFDVQGVRLAKLNVALVPGFNTVSLLDAHLANGRYVVHVNLDGESIHKVISIGNGK